MSPQGGRTEAPQAATVAPAASAAPVRAAGTPHHPALTGENPTIPAGANRVAMDIMHFDDPREGGDGSSTGRMYLPGYDPDSVGEGEVYVRQDRPGGPWVASDLPGGMPQQSARTPQELMAKVARLYGIHGEMRIEDERDGVRKSQTGVTRIEPEATKPSETPKRGSIEAKIEAKKREIVRRESAVSIAFGARTSTGSRIQSRRESTARAALSQARSELRALEQQRDAEGFRTVVTAVTGPGNVPLGGTDADRRAARPRIPGESDRAYEIRTAPSRDAALRILNGHQAAGLRNIAREEGVVTSGSKADLVARLIRVMRDRHEDSAAIERMVGRGMSTPATSAPIAAPRTNAPATSGSITPTMTGAQLLAQRRAARNT